MKTALKKLTGLKRELEVELPIKLLNDKINISLNEMKSKVNLDGFRKGKIPISIIKSRYGASIKNEETHKLIKETLYSAFSNEKVSPAATPELKDIKDNKDSLCYTIAFEVFDDIKTVKLDNLKIEKFTAKIQTKNVNNALKELQDQHAEYKNVKRASKINDRVLIDFKGLLNGKEFEGGDAKDFNLILGKKTMIKGFEEGLVAKKLGDEVKLNLTFPKDYHVEKLAAKKVVFEIKIKKIEQVNVPKLDDELAKKYNKKDIAELKQDVKQHMQAELNSKLENKNKEIVFNKLIESNDMKIPESIIKEEANEIFRNTKEKMEKQNLAPNKNMSADLFNEQAKRRIKLGLLISKIIKDNKIDVSDADIKKKITDSAEIYGEQKNQMIDWYYQDESRLKDIKSVLLENKAVEFILNKAKVTTIEQDFNEIMRAK